MAEVTGMSEFVNASAEGFDCVLKARYGDFVVNEIGEDMAVVRLGDASEPALPAAASASAQAVSRDHLAALVTPLKLAEMDKLADSLFRTEVTVDVTEKTKEARTLVHQGVRGLFQGKLESETKEGCIVVRKALKGKGARKRGDWAKERGGDYLHFTLAKENKDTNDALAVLAQKLHTKPRSLGIAGLKDKRAVTCQRVSAWRVEPALLAKLNSSLRGMRLGSFAYEKAELKLGQHFGNQFGIALREVAAGEAAERERISARVAEWSERGFVNYFGSQRFGTTSVPTWAVGKAVVGGDYEKAVELIMAPREEDEESVGRAHREWTATRKAGTALGLLEGRARHSSVEATVLKALSVHGPAAHLTALQALPRHSRSLYIHAYQSFLWNRLVSRRVRTFGQRVLKGDLRKTPQGGTEAVAEAEGVDIFDVVMPLPSGEMTFPENEIGAWYNELFLDEGIGQKHFGRVAQDFGVHETWRCVFGRPLKAEHRWEEYTDPTKLLVPNDLEEQRDERERAWEEGQRREEAPAWALVVSFALPAGAYATVALRELCKRDLSKQQQMKLTRQRLQERKDAANKAQMDLLLGEIADDERAQEAKAAADRDAEAKAQEEAKRTAAEKESQTPAAPSAAQPTTPATGTEAGEASKLPPLKPQAEKRFIGPVIPKALLKKPRTDEDP